MSKNIVSLRQMKEIKNEKGNLIDISTVGKFETEKYLGEWYEIARYDHRFEKNLKDVMATYILQKNGMIKVVNKGFDKKKGLQKKIVGKAKITDAPGLLRVSFFWIFYSDYRILLLDDNYEWALVSAGHSNKYLWILGREPELSKEILEKIFSEAERRGFDTSKLIFN